MTNLQHKGPRLIITGIPTSGKSFLARKLAHELGAICVILDNEREVIGKSADALDPNDLSLEAGAIRKANDALLWYWNHSDREKEYLAETPPSELWKHLHEQSSTIWPHFLNKINSFADEIKPVIFEAVNLIPSIVTKDLGVEEFPGIVLIGSTYEQILERNIAEPRWGNTRELQEIEANYFFTIERPNYKSEGDRFGYKVFETADEAYEYAKSILVK